MLWAIYGIVALGLLAAAMMSDGSRWQGMLYALLFVFAIGGAAVLGSGGASDDGCVAYSFNVNDC